MGSQPSGTVTLVFTDIEGSTRLLEELGVAAYREALAAHRVALRQAFARYGGYEVDYEGDAFFYAFSSAADAARAVGEAMAALEGGPIRIRVGIHTGRPEVDPPKYVGLDVHRGARVMAAAHGGQVVVSAATRPLLDTAALVDLGEHRLKDFPEPERLYQLGAGEFPPLKTLMTTTLPVPATSFVGRELELDQVLALLGRAWLVTLTGPGGTGKTRLALRAAEAAAASFSDGLWWVPLASVLDASLFVPELAHALHVPEQGSGSLAERLGDRIAGKSMLIVLDNLEQLLPAVAGPLARLREFAGPTFLVTSRERVRVQGEHVFQVPVLTDAAAAELFCARAAASAGSFVPPPSLPGLCAKLDNLPLALELAAARTPMFSVDELLGRLAQRLDLFRGDRDSDPRQATLRATIEWSYDLLSASERRLFAGLGIFSGGWTLEAAEEICGATIDEHASLLDKSLVRRRGERFVMLETVRELALEKLRERGEWDAVHLRRQRFFFELAGRAAPYLRGGSEQAHWLDALEPDLDNLRATLGWARETGDSRFALELASNVSYFWLVRGHWEEAEQALTATLAGDPEPSTQRIEALHVAGFIAGGRGRPAEGDALLREGAETAALLGDESQRLRLSVTRAGVLASGGDLAGAVALLEEEIPRARSAGDSSLRTALVNLSDVLLQQGDSERAAAVAHEAVEQCRGRAPRALAMAVGNLGLARLAQGDLVEAWRLTLESLALFDELGDAGGIAGTISTLGAILAEQGSLQEAAVFLGKAEAMFAAVGMQMGAVEQVPHERAREAAGRALGDDRLSALLEEGAALSATAVIDRARGKAGR